MGISTVVTPNQVRKALDENPDAIGVLITRPSYYGICSDIEEIARIVHSYDKILAVDEAHGAHLKFCRELPVCAMGAGADICVQSAHKTLPSLTQGSYLHIGSDRIDMDRLQFNLSILQTSSPSYIIMTFLDIAREIMEREGSALLNSLLENMNHLSSSIGRYKGLFLPVEDDIMYGKLDKTRLAVNVRDLGMTGFDTEKLLRDRYAIQAEMSDFYNVVFITTVADTGRDLLKLENALTEIADQFDGNPPLPDTYIEDLALPSQIVGLRDILCRKGTRIKLAEAAGRISRGMITPYPPGIPVICPGEIITKDALGYIQGIINAGGIVTGLEDYLTIDVI
jgi:arginine decarboxylase